MQSEPQPPLSFENTEVAFSSKSNSELKKAYYLFKLIGNPNLVKLGAKLTHTALSLGIPIGWAIKSNIFAQFCGGENIAECARATRVLDKFHIGTILDYSVEGKNSEADLDETLAETLRTLHTAKGNPHIPFCVFKVTGICRFELLEKVNAQTPLTAEEQAEWERAKKRVETICALAHSTGTPVFIDAEDSWIQDAIDQLAEAMMFQFNKEHFIVYNTLQMYRHDRMEYLQNFHEKARAAGVRSAFKLVRGAYMEKERQRAAEKGYKDPIQPSKEASDRDFNFALHYCVENRQDMAICCGSHNEESSLLLTQLMEQHGVEKNDPRFYFAQLFGMSDHISFNLANKGYNVAKYVPYGPIREVIPYLLRRAQENTSVKGQTGRELSLILKEKRRRGL